MSDIEQKLRRNSDWRDERWRCITDPALLIEAADTIARLRAKNERLTALLVGEREENLWNAYHSGHVKDGRWMHMFMSDGEWIARECGFDPSLADYDDAEIRAAIPNAARAALEGEG